MTRTPELGCYAAIKVADLSGLADWSPKLTRSAYLAQICRCVMQCMVVHILPGWLIYSGDLNPSHLAPIKGPAEVMNPHEYVMGT